MLSTFRDTEKDLTASGFFAGGLAGLTSIGRLGRSLVSRFFFCFLSRLRFAPACDARVGARDSLPPAHFTYPRLMSDPPPGLVGYRGARDDGVGCTSVKVRPEVCHSPVAVWLSCLRPLARRLSGRLEFLSPRLRFVGGEATLSNRLLLVFIKDFKL